MLGRENLPLPGDHGRMIKPPLARTVGEYGLGDSNTHEAVSAEAVVRHIRQLLFGLKPPPPAPEIQKVDGLPEIHNHLMEIRRQLEAFSKGEFSTEITVRGYLAGSLKSLQANLRHLVWRMRRVEEGDLNQRADFMGEFSSAFNKMVRQLDEALGALRQKEEELVVLARELESEVERRGAALAALQESEENFKYLAEHDPLTGLLNRRSFFARAEMERARDSIMDRQSAIALMDVDHFKRFNDTHGHPNGDIALRHIARLGAESLREADIMGRYGGEEFIFLFANSSLEKVVNAAERIRRRIGASPVKLADREVYLTASFGVTAIPSDLPAKPDLNVMQFAVGLADSALYQAKEDGRNLVRATEFPKQLPSFPDGWDH